MRYKDLAHFRTRHPKLADLLESDRADRIAFLGSMRDAVTGRKNVTPKMIAAMKKFLGAEDAPLFDKSDRWTSVEVEIVRPTANRDDCLDIVHYVNGKPVKARIQVNPRQYMMCGDRLAALGAGETISAFVTGAVVWVSDDKRFPILDVEVESISTVDAQWFEGVKKAPGFAPTETPADHLFDPIHEAPGVVAPPPPPPPTMREKLLPDFSKWQSARAFTL